MRIENMFRDDINRKINGVVQVGQDTSDVLVQELDEYVITRELKKHFISFFNNYGDSFNEPNADTGVWISGFFGSGKSHFLKMLSYLLENKEVQGEKTVERFRKKFEDDPATFMLIDNATKGETDTILFNIDAVNSGSKDDTAVRRVFSKMFYNYLGYYGEDLKVAKLEQHVDKLGKTEEFHKAFEAKNGSSWLESRDAFAFFEDDIVATLQEVLGMSESAAQNWFNGEEAQTLSVEKLVSEIKEYVDAKPDNFRLLFMADEVGQFVGEDTSLLLNLQSIVEEIGSKCSGKVWIVCTGQEAIDEVIKTRENEFSRIQARFKTRLSLSSASADEVIQKRILAKKDDAAKTLEQVYSENDSALRNLFTFTDARKDIRGYEGSDIFIRNFPFVPYQFILMQKVFAEIRKHGNSGKHLSGGERSMLSGFQEAAQKIQGKDEYALAPFYLFYDTVHTFLDSSIRNVIERCERAATDGKGVEAVDADVLKLLYLIRYVEDVPANLDNIVILMADDIRLDKINMRERVRESLDRLMSQNYIGRTGDTYQFLTDEEQDIQREIKNTTVATADIVKSIADRIFLDIYSNKKFRYDNMDFSFDQIVDGQNYGQPTGGMKLRVLTVATDATEKSDAKLTMDSKGEAVIALADTKYYESIEQAMKIRKYVKQRNVQELPESMRRIIGDQQEEAGRYEKTAVAEIKKALEGGNYYVDGERINLTSGDAKKKIDQALEYLVSHVYSEMSLINKKSSDDSDVRSILDGNGVDIEGNVFNQGAVAKVEEYLEMQSEQNLPTTMSDVQSRYQAIPYGWKEIDVAAVVAQLIFDQKVTIKVGGETIQPSDPKLVDMLRKRSETGKTQISKRQIVSAQKIRAAREFLRDYFDTMDVPEDEDGLVGFIKTRFTEERVRLQGILDKYQDHKYPDRVLVANAVKEMEDVLSQQKDNSALIDRVIKKEEELYELHDKMQNVEAFFKNQVQIFDAAVKYEDSLRVDREVLNQNDAAHDALNKIRLITMVDGGNFDYKRIPELNGLMDTVRKEHGAMLDAKRAELMEVARECLAEIHTAAGHEQRTLDIVDREDKYFDGIKQQIQEETLLRHLDGLMPPMWSHKDNALAMIEARNKPMDTRTPPSEVHEDDLTKPEQKKVIKEYYRQAIFPAKTLTSEEEIDEYLEGVRKNMKRLLSESDGIKIN